jgi:hypothetical protein
VAWTAALVAVSLLGAPAPGRAREVDVGVLIPALSRFLLGGAREGRAVPGADGERA